MRQLKNDGSALFELFNTYAQDAERSARQFAKFKRAEGTVWERVKHAAGHIKAVRQVIYEHGGVLYLALRDRLT